MVGDFQGLKNVIVTDKVKNVNNYLTVAYI